MVIGLVDADSHNFPNLPLMKLSGWHKAQGDQVKWYNTEEHFDRVYISKVFTESEDPVPTVLANGNADEVINGGEIVAVCDRDEKKLAKAKEIGL